MGVNLSKAATSDNFSTTVSKRGHVIPTLTLIQACSEGDITAVQAHIEAGGSIVVEDTDGRTPLLAATMSNQQRMVKLLLENGARSNTPPTEPLRKKEIPSELPVGENITIFTQDHIGRGAFGSVFKGKYKGKPCAVKLLYAVAYELQTGLSLSSSIQGKSIKRFEMECKYLESFDHPNIVKHLATATHTTMHHLLLVLELMECNLRDFFMSQQGKDLLLPTQIKLCTDIASALAYIHSKRIVHRDIFSDNILLNNTGYGEIPVAKLCDFGMSKLACTCDDNDILSLVGKRHKGYLPPEATAEPLQYDPSFDMFSFGVIMIQIARQLPTVESERKRMYELSQVNSMNPLRPLILMCLEDEIEKRPSAEALKKRLIAH